MKGPASQPQSCVTLRYFSASRSGTATIGLFWNGRRNRWRCIAADEQSRFMIGMRVNDIRAWLKVERAKYRFYDPQTDRVTRLKDMAAQRKSPSALVTLFSSDEPNPLGHIRFTRQSEDTPKVGEAAFLGHNTTKMAQQWGK